MCSTLQQCLRRTLGIFGKPSLWVGFPGLPRRTGATPGYGVERLQRSGADDT